MDLNPRRVEDRVGRRLPGFLEAPWRLLSRTVTDSIDDRVPGLAAEAAFFALLSLPPLLLAVLGAFSYVDQAFAPGSGTDVTSQIETAIRSVVAQVFAGDTVTTVMTIVHNLLGEQGQLHLLSIGVVFSLWAASRATSTFITAITIAYDVEDPRPVWHRRLLALGLTLGGIVAGVVVLPALILGKDVVAYLTPDSVDAAARNLMEFAFWPTLVVVTVLLLTAFYHVGVPWQTPWRRDLPGALLAMTLWLIGSFALRYYVDATIRTRASLEAFAAPLVAMLWLYVTSLAVLLGAELNAEIERFWPHDDRPRPNPA